MLFCLNIWKNRQKILVFKDKFAKKFRDLTDLASLTAISLICHFPSLIPPGLSWLGPAGQTQNKLSYCNLDL